MYAQPRTYDDRMWRRWMIGVFRRAVYFQVILVSNNSTWVGEYGTELLYRILDFANGGVRSFILEISCWLSLIHLHKKLDESSFKRQNNAPETLLPRLEREHIWRSER